MSLCWTQTPIRELVMDREAILDTVTHSLALGKSAAML